jgi:hypothetical protein
LSVVPQNSREDEEGEELKAPVQMIPPQEYLKPQFMKKDLSRVSEKQMEDDASPHL